METVLIIIAVSLSLRILFCLVLSLSDGRYYVRRG